MKVWNLLIFGIIATVILCIIDLSLLHYINQHLVNIGAMNKVYSWETIAYVSIALSILHRVDSKSDDEIDLADSVISAIASRLIVAATLVVFSIVW